MKKNNIIKVYNYFLLNKGKSIKGYELDDVHLGSTCFFLFFKKNNISIKLFVTSNHVDREVINEGVKYCGEVILSDSHTYRNYKNLGGLIESMMNYEEDLTSEVLDLGINWD